MRACSIWCQLQMTRSKQSSGARGMDAGSVLFVFGLLHTIINNGMCPLPRTCHTALALFSQFSSHLVVFSAHYREVFHQTFFAKGDIGLEIGFEGVDGARDAGFCGEKISFLCLVNRDLGSYGLLFNLLRR
jgi:hypothetical protein